MTAVRPPYTLSTIVKLVRRRKWQIMLPAIAIAGAASWWIHQLPNRYRSDALLLVVSQRVPETFVRSTVTTRSENRLQSITQQILSRTHLEQIIRDFDLYDDQLRTAVMEDIVESMRSRDIQIQPVKGDAFRLGFIADSPEVAMGVVDRLASLFIGQTSLDRATLAEGTDHFLEQQLADVRGKLVDNEVKLGDYRRRHNGELPKQLDGNVQGLHSTETQIQALTDSLNRDRDRQLTLERSLKDVKLTELVEAGSATVARAGSVDTSAASATDQLRRAEAALKDMRSTLTEQHPDVVTLRQTIGDLRKRAEVERTSHVAAPDVSAADQLRRSRLDELQTDLSAVEQQITQKVTEQERLRILLVTYQNRIEVEPTREAELAALTRDYDTLQETYRGLLTKKQESEISANLERQQIDAQFKVLDPARLPERPFAPNRPRLYAAGSLGGLGIGLLFAAILEWFDRPLRTEDDVRAALGVPVLAAIPLVSTRRSIRRGVVTADLVDTRLVVHPEADQVFVEQYRRFGAALHQAQLRDGVGSVMVASAIEAEGKTLSATNLALVLSRSFNKRVLLVDGDLRKPAIHEWLRLENDYGLSDILERPDWRLLAQSVSPALSVITGGRHDADPVALLTSHVVDQFLVEARADFDWVIVDTPPILLFPDAGLFAERLGTCVMAINAESTASPAAAKAIAAIGASRILGALLNRADPTDIAGGYGYSHYGYGERGEARDRFTWWPSRQR